MNIRENHGDTLLDVDGEMVIQQPRRALILSTIFLGTLSGGSTGRDLKTILACTILSRLLIFSAADTMMVKTRMSGRSRATMVANGQASKSRSEVSDGSPSERKAA